MRATSGDSALPNAVSSKLVLGVPMSPPSGTSKICHGSNPSDREAITVKSQSQTSPHSFDPTLGDCHPSFRHFSENTQILWEQYDRIVATEQVDEDVLERAVTTEKARGKFLEWSLRDGYWEVVSYLLEAGVTESAKRLAFRKVAGGNNVQIALPVFFANSKFENRSYVNGRREAVAMAVGLAAMAADFSDDVVKLLEEEVLELPAWILAECILREGPEGKRLLEKCLRNREHQVKGETPSGLAFVNDQMAFLGIGPRTALSDNPHVLINHDYAVDTLLPRKLDMLNIMERWQVAMARAEVRVFYVKGVCGCNSEILHALADSPTNEALGTDAAYAIIEHAWLVVLLPYSLDCVLNVLYVLALCQITSSVRQGKEGDAASMLLCIAITLKDAVEEVLQLLRTHRDVFHASNCHKLRCFCRYICTLEQASDWTAITTDILGMCAVWSGWNEGLRRMILAIWVGMRWLRALYGLRGFERIGPKMLPILNALQDTAIFMLVVAFFLAAAVHAYYVLGVRDTPSSLYASIMVMLRLGLLGDFDLFELEGTDVSYVDSDDMCSSTQLVFVSQSH
jgi:hypothetical protein